MLKPYDIYSTLQVKKINSDASSSLIKQLFMLFVVLLFSQQLAAQQDAQFSQYMFNGQYFNPAATGADGMMRFQLLHRGQWASYTSTFDDGGTPTTQLFSAAVPLNAISSAVGLVVINDKIASETNQRMQLSYAYKLNLSNGAVFSIGVRGGLYAKSIDGTKYRAVNPNDDKIPIGRTVNQTATDFGIGIYYNTPTYYAGISLDHANSGTFGFDFNGQNTLAKTFYITGGYHYYVSDLIELTPSALVKMTSGAPVSFEGSLIATYHERFWLGASYRIGDAGIALIGANLMDNKALRIGLGFDLTAGGNNAKAPYSYEALISYALPAFKVGKKSIVRTPRFRYN